VLSRDGVSTGIVIALGICLAAWLALFTAALLGKF
jgi:hypothetical protein